VATALNGVIVRGDRNMLAETAAPSSKGARAALEAFYYAFNTRSLDLMQRIWADDPLVQLYSPVAGLVRGAAGIAAAYKRGFSGSVRLQTVLEDIVAYVTPDLVVFTARERGTSTHESEPEAMTEHAEGRSICIFRSIATYGGWRLVYHHVSLDDPDQLVRFRRAVRSA
jgi:ketosteroid isomerase-like protein